MDLAGLARSLRSEAERSGERRMLVLAGARAAGVEAARLALEAADVDLEAVTVVGPESSLPAEHVPAGRADRLLGTTREAVVLDAHEALRPNAVGQVVGAVDGGGLFVLLAPPLEAWPERRDAFDERLAAPPYGADAVTGHFRRRFVERLRVHRGVAVVDVDEEWVADDGLTDPAPRLGDGDAISPPEGHAFPASPYERCATADQAAAVHALETLRSPDRAAVVEADRGRGKSSAGGLAAGALALAGEDVLVTAPAAAATGPLFERAREVLADEGVLAPGDDAPASGPEPLVVGADGGRVRFLEPADAVEAAAEADVLLVDEAAALPVRRLRALLSADRVAFLTTIHGYEGAGRGFSVRFRDALEEGRHEVTEVRLDEPIRYAPGDPVEAWAFDALLLDARPAVDQVVADARPATVSYRRLDADDLLADEHLLREAFGLLVLAHYRTEPDDLARLLDAPNVAVRALLVDGHVASVALLAREGGLDAETRAEMYDGGRIRGNMLPDVLTSQLRDESAAVAVGARVLRIATHPAVRSRGLGSRLLARLRTEATDGLAEWADAPAPPAGPDADARSGRAGGAGLDWLGVGFGATPDLLAFWAENDFRTVHLATTRNARSGEYSALLLAPLTERGQALHDRTARHFGARAADVLRDALDDADADVVRAALAATDATAAPTTNLTDWEWRVVAGAAFGPGLADVAPGPFATLAVRHLVDPADPEALSARQERLLVRKALQTWRWDAVAEDLDFASTGQAMRAYGAAFQPLVTLYGTDVAHAERARYVDDEAAPPALEGQTLPGDGSQERDDRDGG